MKPPTWEIRKVSEIVSSERNSIVGGPFGSDLVSRDYVPVGVPVIRGANMGRGRWVSGEFVFVTEAKADALAANCAKPGDLVFTQRGTIGQVALVPSEGFSRYLLSQSQMKLTADAKKADALFLFYTFSGYEQQKYIQQNAIRTGVPHTNLAILRDTPILLPPPAQQKEIAAIADNLDAKIELNNQINAELEAMAKLLYDYWFVQFDFPMTAAQAAALGRSDLEGKPYRSSGGKMVHNPTLNREIPEAWEADKLDSIVESIFTGLNPRKHFELGHGDNFYVTIKNIEHGRVILDEKCDKVDDEALVRINRRSDLNAGDILFTSIEPVGRLYLVHEKPKNWNINESIFSIRPKDSIVTSAYLYYLLSSDYCRGYCKKVSTGSIHKGIRITDLRAFEFERPPATLIQAFTEISAPLLRQAFLLEEQNQELAQLRDWLLPMLMNGQVRVS